MDDSTDVSSGFRAVKNEVHLKYSIEDADKNVFFACKNQPEIESKHALVFCKSYSYLCVCKTVNVSKVKVYKG